MTILQFFAIIFSLFALSRVLLRTKDKKLTIPEFVFWIFIWSGLIVLAFVPYVSVALAEVVGIGRGIDFIIYVSVGLLFYLIFRLYIKIEEIEQQMGSREVGALFGGDTNGLVGHAA